MDESLGGLFWRGLPAVAPTPCAGPESPTFRVLLPRRGRGTGAHEVGLQTLNMKQRPSALLQALLPQRQGPAAPPLPTERARVCDRFQFLVASMRVTMVVCLLSTYYGQAECWPHTRVTTSVSTDPAGRTGGAEAWRRDASHQGEPGFELGPVSRPHQPLRSAFSHPCPPSTSQLSLTRAHRKPPAGTQRRCPGLLRASHRCGLCFSPIMCNSKHYVEHCPTSENPS